jgi:hypothetical protein
MSLSNSPIPIHFPNTIVNSRAHIPVFSLPLDQEPILWQESGDTTLACQNLNSL